MYIRECTFTTKVIYYRKITIFYWIGEILRFNGIILILCSNCTKYNVSPAYFTDSTVHNLKIHKLSLLIQNLAFIFSCVISLLICKSTFSYLQYSPITMVHGQFNNVLSTFHIICFHPVA